MGLKEKGLLAFLIFLGLGALILGFLKIRGGIYGPFWRPVAPAFRPEGSGSIEQTIALQNKDTDQDGLSDFEESYVYKTSIYLPDTDGDGFTDKEEIEKGYDPLCPKGEECGRSQISTNDDSQIGTNEESQISTNEIRESLIKAGVDQETLDKVDDQTLREIYEETVKETGINPENLQTNGVQNEGSSPALAGERSFANMDTDEIRKLLIQEGVDESQLNQIDDETLRKMYEEATRESL